MKYRFSILLLVGLVGCAAKVDGKLDTSGTQTVNINLVQLQGFFKSECPTILGPGATQAEISSCVTQLTTDYNVYNLKP